MAHHTMRHHWHYYYRRPSRLLWFALGSGTTFWYLSHREMRDGANWGFCSRVRALPLPSSYATSPPRNAQTGDSYGSENGAKEVLQARKRLDKEWEEEKMRMAAFTHRASDKVADISEATLDSILATVEGLKVKLGEHRKQAEEAKRKLHEMESRVETTPTKSSSSWFR